MVNIRFCSVVPLFLMHKINSLLGFRELTQIIGIKLQVGVWMTHFMWNLELIGLPNLLVVVFKIPSIYCIVDGYRDVLISKAWFWDKSGFTIYYWILTIFVLGIGASLDRNFYKEKIEINIYMMI